MAALNSISDAGPDAQSVNYLSSCRHECCDPGLTPSAHRCSQADPPRWDLQPPVSAPRGACLRSSWRILAALLFFCSLFLLRGQACAYVRAVCVGLLPLPTGCTRDAIWPLDSCLPRRAAAACRKGYRRCGATGRSKARGRATRASTKAQNSGALFADAVG